VPVDERAEPATALTSGGEAHANAALVRADVLILMREKRYEEALALLYRARSEAPGNAELQKSIDQIKEFLIGAYAKRLGGLDRVAKPIAPSSGRSPDMVLVSRYIDGTSTFGDVAQMCPLGQLRTLQVLVGMYPRESTAGADSGPPHSGLRPPVSPPAVAAVITLVEPDEEPAPETARSAPFNAAPLAETEDSKRYREAFALGTAAFIQRRFEDAVSAFETCARLRPGDSAAEVMLRRSQRDLESR
jgi:tetratricopeptide (TPR) repeat protein